ncbi:hypothetical protein AAG906_001263 [Vitis piasezkii]
MLPLSPSPSSPFENPSPSSSPPSPPPPPPPPAQQQSTDEKGPEIAEAGEGRKGFLSVAWRRNDPDPQISSKAGVELSAAAMVLTADGDLISATPDQVSRFWGHDSWRSSMSMASLLMST